RPKALFVVGGYRYGGKSFDRREELRGIVTELPGLNQVIDMSHLGRQGELGLPTATRTFDEIIDCPAVPASEFVFEQVPFDHPLWILFSSGTTGLLKSLSRAPSPVPQNSWATRRSKGAPSGPPWAFATLRRSSNARLSRIWRTSVAKGIRCGWAARIDGRFTLFRRALSSGEANGERVQEFLGALERNFRLVQF